MQSKSLSIISSSNLDNEEADNSLSKLQTKDFLEVYNKSRQDNAIRTKLYKERIRSNRRYRREQLAALKHEFLNCMPYKV